MCERASKCQIEKHTSYAGRTVFHRTACLAYGAVDPNAPQYFATSILLASKYFRLLSNVSAALRKRNLLCRGPALLLSLNNPLESKRCGLLMFFLHSKKKTKRTMFCASGTEKTTVVIYGACLLCCPLKYFGEYVCDWSLGQINCGSALLVFF